MRKCLRLSSTVAVAVLFSLNVTAQSVTLTGKVKNNSSKENVPAVSVTVKGASQGAYTDENGNFRLTVNKLPVTLIVSSVGFESREITVSSPSQALAIDLNPASILGQEVVVSATRAPERILESPVTVEKLGGVTLRNAPAPSYYEAINNVKGVDMHTASLTFRTVTTRGFVASGNTRFNQLIDGMDNQAPGLNFSVGNIIGPSDLDIDNMEMLSGASSALYGSGGMNGTLLINTKSPFKYQGLSFQIKQGAMHLQDRYQKPTPYYDWSARYGKAWNDKIGFKISAQFIKANDWQAYDEDNVQRTSVVSKVVAGNRTTDPNYDGVNVYGDETSANVGLVSQQLEGGIRGGVLQATGIDIAQIGAQYAGSVGTQSLAAITAFVNALPAQYAPLKPTLMQYLPLYVANRGGLVPNQNVSRTGYQERDLVDYNTINFKGTAGLFYKITPRIEASLNSYWGTGTTVYTGADRYSLKNLQMAQHKLEIRHANWFLRGYTTQENSGDSYNATVLGRIMNERFKPSSGQTGWYSQYTGAYVQGRLSGLSDYQARTNARNLADAGMPMPGTQAFEDLKKAVASAPIGKDPMVNGAKFLDRSDLWAAEGQLNVSNSLGFTSTVDMIAGVQYKQYVLNSQGTLFADTAGKLKPSEIGGYIQLRKGLFNNVLNLTAAGRYDKHTNFEGRFTPRVTAVIKVFKDNNIRLSYQTAYRFPTNQDQYINLNVGSGLLIGGLESFQTYYNLNSTNPGYTSESVIAARTASDPSKLVAYQYKELKPESVSSYEIGYKGVAGKRLFYDAYGYYSRYKNFLGRVAVVQSLTGSSTGALDPSAAASRNLSYVQNSDQQVNALGWGVSAEYNIARSYFVFGNVFSDELRDVPEGYITFFNAPKYRTNLGLRADNAYKGIGFNIVWKWQDANYYEGTFVTGTIPSFHTIDAQVSYRLPQSKSIIRIGATNLANQYYRSGYGSPYVGGLYYASFGYNIF